SAHGEGTTFTVSIPFGHEHLPAESVADADDSPLQRSVGQSFVGEAVRWLPGPQGPVREAAGAETPQVSRSDSRPRILLADDNRDMREYVTRLLSSSYDVVAVNDGRAALEAARRHRPDLVLTDIMMPDVDGFALLELLRDDPMTAGIPVMLLSARAGEESRLEGLS